MIKNRSGTIKILRKIIRLIRALFLLVFKTVCSVQADYSATFAKFYDSFTKYSHLIKAVLIAIISIIFFYNVYSNKYSLKIAS
jgi:hypothetical protein